MKISRTVGGIVLALTFVLACDGASNGVAGSDGDAGAGGRNDTAGGSAQGAADAGSNSGGSGGLGEGGAGEGGGANLSDLGSRFCPPAENVGVEIGQQLPALELRTCEGEPISLEAFHRRWMQ